VPFYALAPRLAHEPQRQAALLNADATSRSPAALSDLVEQSARLFGTPMGLATIVAARKVVVIARHGYDFEDLDRDVSFCAHVVARPQSVTVVLDAAKDLRFAGHPLVRGLPQIRFYVGAPLLSPCGEALGALCAIDTEPHSAVSDAQCQALQDLAGRVAAELLGN
jgi:GAF domain-containing protein